LLSANLVLQLVVYYLPALLTDATFGREIDRPFADGVLLAEPVTGPATGPSREGGGTYIHGGFRINYSLALRSGGEILARMERTAIVFTSHIERVSLSSIQIMIGRNSRQKCG
jgi:hypothetical protein